MGWYHVYSRHVLLRKYVNNDVFKLILAYLDTVDLRYLLEGDGMTVVLRHTASDDTFSWRTHNEAKRSPCHVCMRPCRGYNILCSFHGVVLPENVCFKPRCCLGEDELCRRHLHTDVWKCGRTMRLTDGCNGITYEMAGSCAKKVRHVILPGN